MLTLDFIILKKWYANLGVSREDFAFFSHMHCPSFFTPQGTAGLNISVPLRPCVAGPSWLSRLLVCLVKAIFGLLQQQPASSSAEALNCANTFRVVQLTAAPSFSLERSTFARHAAVDIIQGLPQLWREGCCPLYVNIDQNPKVTKNLQVSFNLYYTIPQIMIINTRVIIHRW